MDRVKGFCAMVITTKPNCTQQFVLNVNHINSIFPAFIRPVNKISCTVQLGKPHPHWKVMMRKRDGGIENKCLSHNI